MALIKCPDCRKEISSRAAQCIHCGCPIGDSGPKTITIERTKKSIKAIIALGVIIFLCGVGWSFVTIILRNSIDEAVFPGVITTGAGIIVLIYATILNWWHHG